MASTSAQRSGLASIKVKKAPPVIKTTLVKKTVSASASSPTGSQRLSATPKLGSPLTNGHHKSKSTTPRRSKTPVSRQASKEPAERIKKEKAAVTKRSSPVATTPRFLSDDEEEEAEQPKKRARLENPLDPDRNIADAAAFSSQQDADAPLEMIHAYDIANDGLVEHQRNKYATFFTALAADEDDAPTIELRYPGYPQPERYQLVKPSSDHSDFKPITEIFDNIKMVADTYLLGSDSLKLFSEADGSGLYQKAYKFLRDGEKSRVGAQSHFISVIEEYNAFIQQRRDDGTIQHSLNNMHSVPLSLVEHIVKGQIYARTVSPQVHLVRQYEGFSDNVYGELLPKFLSKIFREVGLKSTHTFVDLGSGVGNCVLQAALETGCEAWGCEMMDNCATLAELQAREFPARCRLWGIKPGPVRLIHDDFLRNPEVDDVLKRADVILINNQAFTADLNDKLKLKFLDLKEGCRIVSLKCFRHPHHVIKQANVNDPVNVLEVKEMHRYSDMVSWTDDPGNWYVQTKNSSELKRFLRTLPG
ncbi:hypothetical protein DV738_g5248, partial [Chaetothyriales sp. CBS 135597]